MINLFWRCYGEYRGKRALKPFIAYMIAKHEETQRVVMFELYTSDSLRLLLQSVSSALGGSFPELRYGELIGIYPQSEIKEPEKTADEIISKFVADLGGNKQ